MELPADLIQRIQHEYVSTKYKDGMFTFPILDDETIIVVIKGFLEWVDKKGMINDNSLDLSTIEKW